MRTRQLKKTRVPQYDVLDDNEVNNPDNALDVLPLPYSIIDEVLNETILFQLNLKMHEIQEKKKNSNYEGSVKEYLAQNTMDIEGISCLSQPQKSHNHLLAGDKSGNVYLLDLAKKAIFSKKQVVANKRVNKIIDSMITDGDNYLTTAAVIFQNHNSIHILRYKHSEPKIYLTFEVKVAPDCSDPNLLPFDCEIHDYCRLLIVKIYNGSILAFRIPEVKLQVQKFTKSTSVPLEQEEVKKILKYPLNMLTLETQVKTIEEKVLEIKFPGARIPPKYSEIKARLMKKKEVVVDEGAKKDPKKKQEKKVQSQEQIPKQEYIFNDKLDEIQSDLRNGMDQSASYPLPKYEPFALVCSTMVGLPKSKYFERSKTVSLVSTIIYGWKNTKEFKIATINVPCLTQTPEFIHLIYHQQKLKQEQVKCLEEYQSCKMNIIKEICFKNVHSITSVGISKPDQSLVAFGLKDGTISVWNPMTYNLQLNTEKHSSSVTCIKFFQKWKIVSGSSNGQVFIHNVVNHKNQVKRTNIFQPKTKISITDIEINELGIAHVIDSQSNMRVYDLWRNQKIAKFNPCTSYAMIQNKGKKWLSSQKVCPCQTIYTNRDFSVILSINWPNFSSRAEDMSSEEKEKLSILRKNPWKSDGTNLHIVRNFEMILNLFEGLENTYKKGYERKKIQNLFSNLEFAQLGDRNFEIPDFGHPPNFKKNESNTNTKSLFSGLKSNQRSEKSLKSSSKSKSKQKSKKDYSESGKNVKLTNEVLHPQKFLLERRKIAKNLMVTDESLVNWIREDHHKKQHRQNKLVTDTSKGVF